jgi:hypothetical protein
MLWAVSTFACRSWLAKVMGARQMRKAKSDGGGTVELVPGPVARDTIESFEKTNKDDSEAVATIAAVAVVGIGAAAFEVALLPGIILGVAAMLLPRYFPRMGEALNPLFRSTVRGVYKMGQKARGMVTEAEEQVQNIVAEVHAENHFEPAVTKRAS